MKQSAEHFSSVPRVTLLPSLAGLLLLSAAGICAGCGHKTVDAPAASAAGQTARGPRIQSMNAEQLQQRLNDPKTSPTEKAFLQRRLNGSAPGAH